MRFDVSNAECLVFTFKEGLLSAIAHDLKIRVERFSVAYDEAAGRVEARFDARSLRVVTAMSGGVESPGALSDKDKAEIERTIQKDVLDGAHYPDIVFTSAAISADGAAGTHRVDGTLTLRGRSHALPVQVTGDGARKVATARLHQPDFGIKPYSAMLGTLKIKPDVEVRVTLRWSAALP